MHHVKELSLKLNGKIYSQNIQRMPLRMSKINQSNYFISDRLACSRLDDLQYANLNLNV